MRRDLLTAYAASAARVLSWVIVSAIVFRASPLHFAILALIRGTMGLLNYTTVGLAPALVKMIAEAAVRPKNALLIEEGPPEPILSYSPARPSPAPIPDSVESVYASGMRVAAIAGGISLVIVLIYAALFREIHQTPARVEVPGLVALAFGFGVVMRLASEAPAAAIQTCGRIAVDNVLLVTVEIIWTAVALAAYAFGHGATHQGDFTLFLAGFGFFISGGFLFVARIFVAGRLIPLTYAMQKLVDPHIMRRLVMTGSLIALAQLADFLYVPTDYILINHLISPDAIAYYGPPLQIDAGAVVACRRDCVRHPTESVDCICRRRCDYASPVLHQWHLERLGDALLRQCSHLSSVTVDFSILVGYRSASGSSHSPPRPHPHRPRRFRRASAGRFCWRWAKPNHSRLQSSSQAQSMWF